MARQVNGHLGTFATVSELTARFAPSEYVGCSANVGTTSPYIKYWCDGQAWAGLPAQQIQALVSRGGIVASDTGSAWTGAPSLLSFSATLDSGTTTSVLLEVRDAAGTVATAATITADTVAQVMRQALLLRQNAEYRFRRVSGTGTVTITV